MEPPEGGMLLSRLTLCWLVISRSMLSVSLSKVPILVCHEQVFQVVLLKSESTRQLLEGLGEVRSNDEYVLPFHGARLRLSSTSSST
ncbi:hypothetical protein EDD37DRAFT_621945 [Exophiala viscosa]|uniref:uncharacterized protein n=1 Tax=Exophiala viscosa TaxID=2486360 RepID=UPI0021961EEA|nr:hypothetical protein EDD37DRAFT_621945 [Exophiala viscosa]